MEQVVNAIATYAPYIIGFVMPPAVELINRDIKSYNLRFIITVVICLLVAIILNLGKLSFGTADSLLATLTLIFTESQIAFKLYFKDSSLRAAMQRSPSTIPAS